MNAGYPSLLQNNSAKANRERSECGGVGVGVAAAGAAPGAGAPPSALLPLTEEELALLAKEGWRGPIRLPLSRDDERLLKRVRRKIRNKLSAKNSRIKKQEYMEAIERRLRSAETRNDLLLIRIAALEKANRELVYELSRTHDLSRAARAGGAGCVGAVGPAWEQQQPGLSGWPIHDSDVGQPLKQQQQHLQALHQHQHQQQQLSPFVCATAAESLSYQQHHQQQHLYMQQTAAKVN